MCLRFFIIVPIVLVLANKRRCYFLDHSMDGQISLETWQRCTWALYKTTWGPSALIRASVHAQQAADVEVNSNRINRL